MSKQKTLTIYIGWDSREPIAADVCRYSILENTSIPVNIVYLKQKELRKQGRYTRPDDDLASTEFTFTRFLVPYLNNYDGPAIFVDCDFVFDCDVAELMEEYNPRKAVQVVQHNYTPPEGVKMDGKAQLPYPRKNWSSMILWNTGHKDNRKVDLDFVNTATGQELHRFTWLRDAQIGNLSPEYNWLVGWYREVRDGYPKLYHWTEGGPWFDNYQDCDYVAVWNRYKDLMQADKRPVSITPDMITANPTIKDLVEKLVLLRSDPHNLFHDHSVQDFINQIDYVRLPKIMAVLDGGDDSEENTTVKNDKILENFVIGTDGVVGRMDLMDKTPPSVPIVLRGITKRKVMHQARSEGRDYYYVDTGYFGNDKRKHYHRITKNAMQYFGKLDPECPDDRFVKTGTRLLKYRPGTNILICPPSDKAMKYWNLDLEDWLKITINDIKKSTDRPIVIREKPLRSVRTESDTIEMALSRDVHCMVTFNSIAAVESLIYGKPVFTMGPNAAQPLANTNLADIDNPCMPSMEEIRNLMCNLAYQQFTVNEMRDGTAWQMLNSWYDCYGDPVISK